MSIMYCLNVDLDIRYVEKNIGFVFRSFFEKGCWVLNKEIDDKPVVESYFLTFKQAISKITASTDEERKKFKHILLIKYKDTYFHLYFYANDNGMITVSLFDFSCPWSKNFWYGKEDFVIDFARYINWIIEILDSSVLLNLEMSSDHSDRWPEDAEKNCIVSVISMGSLNELRDVKESLRDIIRNGCHNRIIFFDDNTNQLVESCIQQYYEILKAKFPVCLYAKKDDVPFKIEIKKNVQGYDGVFIYPLEPYRMKKGYGSEEEKIDVAFYVERLLELCENFAIYQLKSFF